MRRINYIALFLIMSLIIYSPLRAEVDYEPSQLPTLVGDFNLSYHLLDEHGFLIQDTVNEIATIRILPENESDGQIYTLTLYLDRSYALIQSSITLPYDFKWNFRGLSNGEHELYFVLKDSKGNLGVLRVNILVQH